MYTCKDKHRHVVPTSWLNYLRWLFVNKTEHRMLKGPNICNVFGKQWVQGYHIKRSLFVRQPDQTKCIWIQRKESLQSRGHLIQELVFLFYLLPIIFFFKPVAKTCFCHFVCPSLCPCVQLNKDYTKNLNIWIALITEQEVKRKQTFGSIVRLGTPCLARNALCCCKAWLARVACRLPFENNKISF